MAIFFINPYKNYYDKLNNSKTITTSSKNILNNLTNISQIMDRLNTQITSSNWSELGCDEIKNTLIPNIQKKVTTLNSDITSGLDKVCKMSLDELFPMLEKLKNLDSNYETTRQELNTLSAPNRYDPSTGEETELYRKYISIKDEKVKLVKTYKSSIDELIPLIDEKIKEIKKIESNSSLDQKVIEENELPGTEEYDPTLSDIELKRQQFKGNVDTDEYYVSSSAGKVAQTLRLFYNGKEIHNKDEIIIKKGETARITVKLPNTAGRIKQLTRTTADGADNWRNIAKGYSEPFVDRYNSNTFLHTNTYDWVITGTKKGSTIISQTAEMSTDTFMGIKSMVVLNLKVVD